MKIMRCVKFIRCPIWLHSMLYNANLFKFARDCVKFVMCILMFIRASREGDWNLYLESLKALAKYFFAHDRLNYAQMVPLYLAQMHRLKIDDPDIHHEFMQGNFCVNKNEISFCAIGPDHSIEHVSKLMKIRGGLKGLNTATSSHGKMVPRGARAKSTCRDAS